MNTRQAPPWTACSESRGSPEPDRTVRLEFRGCDHPPALVRGASRRRRQEVGHLARPRAHRNGRECARRVLHLLVGTGSHGSGFADVTEGAARRRAPRPVWPSCDAVVVGPADRRRAGGAGRSGQDAVLEFRVMDGGGERRALRGRGARDRSAVTSAPSGRVVQREDLIRAATSRSKSM